MNRIALIALLGLLVLAVILYAAFRDRTATLRWDYDYGRIPPCSSPTAVNPPDKQCVLGFKIFLGTPTVRLRTGVVVREIRARLLSHDPEEPGACRVPGRGALGNWMTYHIEQ